jgi:hypothetical protein
MLVSDAFLIDGIAHVHGIRPILAGSDRHT